MFDLWVLAFSDNDDLSGKIPDSISSLAHLAGLWLQSTGLTGSILNMAAMTELQVFNVENAKLSGRMPDTVASLTELQGLGLTDNRLSGVIPDAVGCLSSLREVYLSGNSLSGSLPDASTSWRMVYFVAGCDNSLAGAIPGGLSSWTGLQELFLFCNKLVGLLPVATACWTSLEHVDMHGNHLSGVVPDAARSWSRLWKFRAYENEFAGQLPKAIASWSLAECLQIYLGSNNLSGVIPTVVGLLQNLCALELQDNKLSGAIPEAVAFTRVSDLFLDDNELSGSLPDGLVPTDTWHWNHLTLHVDANRLTGTIPDMLTYTSRVLAFIAGGNKLSGTYPASCRVHYCVVVADNQLIGTLPTLEKGKQVWACSGNSLEGAVPAAMMTPDVLLWCISSQVGGGVGGSLPLTSSRALKLMSLGASELKLEGIIPPLGATLKTLTLHNNRFKVFSGANLPLDGASAVLVFNNLLSCPLPDCGNAPVKLCLAAVGNQLRRSKHSATPAWISPIERDGLFWSSSKEGVVLMLRFISGAALLAAALCTTLRGRGGLVVASRWHRAGPQQELALACSQLLSSIGRAALLRWCCLMLLLSWELMFVCPRTLAMASACLRNSIVTRGLVLLLWSSICFHSVAVRCFRRFGLAPRVVAKRSIREHLGWLSWLLLTVACSFLSMLGLACKSVPGLIKGKGGRWKLLALNLSIGAIQGVLSTLVIPKVTEKLVSNRHVWVTVANLLMNCLLPGVVVMLLDGKCLGNWVALWEPCRGPSALLQQVLECQHRTKVSLVDPSICPVLAVATVPRIRVWLLRQSEVCDPSRSRKQTSMSYCTELIMLRLQDIWLSKFMTSGLFIPAGRISSCRGYSYAGEVVGQLAIVVAFAIITSGHLPLAMPLLWLTALSATLLAALSWDQRELKSFACGGIATLCIATTQVSSSILQLASASGDAHTLLMAAALILNGAMRDMRVRRVLHRSFRRVLQRIPVARGRL